MPAGRPRKPEKVLEFTGAFRKNPQRKRERAAAPRAGHPLGPPPSDWTDGAATNGRCKSLLEIWQQLVEQDLVLRVLNLSHRMLVENTCHLMYKIRRASMGYGKAGSGDYAQVKSNLAAMGMTPIDSPRVAEAVRVPDQGGSSARTGSGWGEFVG
jgi:hypothetical protein